MSPQLLFCSLWIATFATVVTSSILLPRQSCSSGYTLCSPPGASGSDTYDMGIGLLNLYPSILDAVNPQGPAPGTPPQAVNSNGPARRQSSMTMCCASGLSCLLLLNANVPMCYDESTTDYALPNGDYGNVSNGTLVTSSGAQVNLISGEYYLENGQTGNIYSSAISDKLDSTTLPTPTQLTSIGTGSAILASQLGSNAISASFTTITITVGMAISSTTSMSILSLSGPAATPCSNNCGRPSTNINATVPMITSMPCQFGTGTGTSHNITGSDNFTWIPLITAVGVGARLGVNLLMVGLAGTIITTLFIQGIWVMIGVRI